MVDIQLQMMKKVAETGTPDDAWRYGCARLRGYYYVTNRKTCPCRRNTREGLRWLEHAAEHGCEGAMLELSSYYGGLPNTDAMSVNLYRALHWEKIAWRAGSELVAQNIAITYSMLGKRRLCHQWLLRGYKRCKWSTRLLLAKTYLCGYGVRRNMPKSKRLFQAVLGDRYSDSSDKVLAKKYLRMIERGEMPNDNVLYP